MVPLANYPTMSLTPSDPGALSSAPAGLAPRAGRELWFRQEIRAHEATLKGYLRGTFPSVRDIDDVVQESYLRIWKARGAHPIRSAKAFLFKVARHVALDLVRKRKASRVDPLGDLSGLHVIDDGPDPSETASIQEKLDLLADAVISLPLRCREVIILHKIKGFSQKDVAAKLGLSQRTVENHCQSGVRRCEQYLRARGIKSTFEHEP
jgi:RNA polymerase sigma factor (sigma-70 family)